jgi:hypothetical protein
MQLLITIGLLSFTTSHAFASGEFAAKMNAHAQAVATTKAHISRVGDAQLKFKSLMKTCEPKSVSTQQALLGCGKQFLQMNIEFQSLRTSQLNAEKTVSQLPPEFAPAVDSLNKTLKESSKILSIVVDTPEKTSNSFFAANSVFVQKQFERAGQEAFSKNKLNRYCDDLQFNLDTFVQKVKLDLTSKISFSTLYRNQLRMQNTLALAKETTSICRKTYKVDAAKAVLADLNSRITPENYSQFKKTVCPKSTFISAKDCEKLPLTPYTISWLESVRGVK